MATLTTKYAVGDVVWRAATTTVDSAKLKLANAAASNARSALWNIGYLFDQIEEAADKEAIAELVRWYRDYDWQRDKDNINKLAEPPHPIDAVRKEG